MAKNHLGWLVVILIILWFVWFFTGGPQKYESKAGPFLKPPAPIDTGEIYGPKVRNKTKSKI